MAARPPKPPVRKLVRELGVDPDLVTPTGPGGIVEVTQLALSFDHRLVDGELGSRLLADVAKGES